MEFSFRTRQNNLERLKKEEFDLLIMGGGITGAAVARDAVSRGLRVALVEKSDFGSGTSSKSSKLIHGGLRYLENLEWGLVFEALSERALLLKAMPHLVRPLPFYFPVYQEDSKQRWLLSLGFWLYDLLSLFRAPGLHQFFGPKSLLKKIPCLNSSQLKGGFRYFDAFMWDDLIVIELLRSAHKMGAVVTSYLEVEAPFWEKEGIRGLWVRDRLPFVNGIQEQKSESFLVRAKAVVSCVGPWTDLLGEKLVQGSRFVWSSWLSPSQGSHLIFSLEKIPIEGALVMSHPQDGRISFVVPRKEDGIVVVGTTDTPLLNEKASLLECLKIDPLEEEYLLRLLNHYFPGLKLSAQDILGTYTGVRPLVRSGKGGEFSLQKISREHRVEVGPGGVVFVAGGKYTTHRRMAEEIVNTVLAHHPALASRARLSRTRESPSPHVSPSSIQWAKQVALNKNWNIPERLWNRYGSEALKVMLLVEQALQQGGSCTEWEGRMRYAMQYEMALCFDDFYQRRLPFYSSSLGSEESLLEQCEKWKRIFTSFFEIKTKKEA